MSLLPSDLPDPQLRVSPSERDVAASLLREAAAHERLSFEELEARLPQVLSATTRSDLYRVLVDVVPTAALAEQFEGVLVDSEAPGMSWEHPLLLRCDWTGLRRDGVWDVPPFIEVVASGMGSVHLDFCHAKVLARVIDLVVTGNGTVTIVVPHGWGVDLAHVNISDGGMGSQASSSVPTRPLNKNPRIVVSGTTSGGVKVREPNWADRRRHRKLHPRAIESQ